LHEYVPLKLCKRLRSAALALKSPAWSSLIGEGGNMDKYRKSAPAPKKLTKKLYRVITEGCQTFFPNSKPRKWIFLKSL
jgi:hypothetical protein